MYFALAYFIMVLILFNNYSWIIFISFIVYAFSVPTASIFEKYFASKFFTLIKDEKSFLGLLIYFITILVILAIFSTSLLSKIFGGFSKIIEFNTYFIAASISIAVMLTFFEAISSKVFEKFLIPVVTAILLFMFFNTPNPELLLDFTIGLVIAGIIAYASYRVKFLTANGSVATFLLAGFIFGLGGWQWSVPMMTFFILSSLFSKARKKKNKKIEEFFEKTGVRDYMQVLANGGIGGILVILNQIFPNSILYIIYLAVLSAVCADTWATEIGTMFKTNTYNIINFRPVEQGISGGISLIGSLGALAGAFTIAISGILWNELNIYYYFTIVLMGGMIGSFFDSILGATVQAQNHCNVCKKQTEREYHCGEKSIPFRGYHWMNNDIVNLLSGISGGLFIIIIFAII
ncbi:MAG: hypothetical protein A2V66_01215 [Ignavibacteria bacterium RBG_13_36_8]|nr:MAG: hypothetical protein A2V66_01215 [Ignavibacteria bacterium RBG_13_36_8]